MSSAEAHSRSVERGALAARLRLGMIVAWACGGTLIAASAVTEYLTNTHSALLPAVLADRTVQTGILIAGEGFIVLGLWFQVLKSTVGNRSDVSEVQGAQSWRSTALWIGFVIIAALVLAISVIPLIVLLTSPAFSPQHSGALDGDVVASLANMAWASIGFFYWIFRRSNRSRQTAR